MGLLLGGLLAGDPLADAGSAVSRRSSKSCSRSATSEAFNGRAASRSRRARRSIKAEYRPASPSFFGSISLTLNTLPDVTGLAGPVRKLQEIVDQTLQDLDVYSRWVGRTGNARSPAALSAAAAGAGRGTGRAKRGGVS